MSKDAFSSNTVHPHGQRNADDPRQAYRDSRTYARLATEGNDGALTLAGYKAFYFDPANAGIRAKLPPPQEGMDMRAAQQHVSSAQGGAGFANTNARPPSALDRATAGAAGAVPDSRAWMGQEGVANPPPVGNAADFRPTVKTVTQRPNLTPNPYLADAQAGKAGALENRVAFDKFAAGAPTHTEQVAPARSALDRATVGAGANAPFRGSTSDEIAQFYQGDQTAAKNVAQAKASGGVVQTPYGTINGNWQDELVKKYPALGVKGSQANVEFIRSYNAAKQAEGDIGDAQSKVDHHAIADAVMQKIQNPQQPGQVAGVTVKDPTGAAQIAPADIAAPTPINGAQAPVMFAGQDVGAADWKGDASTGQAPAQMAGADMRQRLANSASKIAALPAAPISLEQKAANAVAGGVQSAVDYGKGLLGVGSTPAPATPAGTKPPVSSLTAATNFPLTQPPPPTLSLAVNAPPAKLMSGDPVPAPPTNQTNNGTAGVESPEEQAKRLANANKTKPFPLGF